MNRRILILSIPLLLFLGASVFLYKGLFSDPTKLESVLIDQPIPEFTLQDLHDLDKQHGKDIFTGRPMLLNVWATWCPTC